MRELPVRRLPSRRAARGGLDRAAGRPRACAPGRCTGSAAASTSSGGRWQAGRPRRAAPDRGVPASGSPCARSGGAVSHASAAVLLGLPQPFDPTPVWGTVPPGLPTRYGPGHDACCRRPSRSRDVRTDGRIRRTSLARTVADCLRHLPTVDAVAVADAALRRRPRPRGPACSSVLDDCARLAAARGAAPTRGRWSTAAASPRWSRGRGWRRCDRVCRCPEPQVQTSTTSDGVFLGRVDAWWPEHGVVGEVDGLTQVRARRGGGRRRDAVRRAVQAVVAEKKREDLLRRTGLHVVRWGPSDLRQEDRVGADGPSELRPRRPGAGAGAPGAGAADAPPRPPPLLVAAHTSAAG